jgi:prophage regulatory protein
MTVVASDLGFMRLPQVLSVLPISKTSWYEGIKSKRYPASFRISARAVGWRKSDIFALVEKLGASQ